MLRRPAFPKRAVVTAGMPYGSKELHFGHIGGVFVHADVFSRFLRDRLGDANVLFLSGTDCYGAPIVEKHRTAVEDGSFRGSVANFAELNHKKQRRTLADYRIGLNYFGVSALGRCGELHAEHSAVFFRQLLDAGALRVLETRQFYDEKRGVFLNGRQVIGQCPIEGCCSETAYADECSLGHQYFPEELLDPVSVLSGERPILRKVSNWYFDLEKYRPFLTELVDAKVEREKLRKTTSSACREFLKDPIIYASPEEARQVKALLSGLHCTFEADESRGTLKILFSRLCDREEACERLSAAGIRYRTGKTLVPFRLSGNIDWGVPVPDCDGLRGLTFWVWPESLWAPISFTQAFLEEAGRDRREWQDWWCSKSSAVYQFIGEDNIYFCHLAEMAMFKAINDRFSGDMGFRAFSYPRVISNRHLLFFDKKAASSGKVRPPMARELLEHYSAEQLRAHFLGLGLGLDNAPFPKVYSPSAAPEDPDPVVREWSIFTNLLNRATRTLFYSLQKYYPDKAIPRGVVSIDVKALADETIVSYENRMAEQDFHLIMNLLENYFRQINKAISASIKDAAADPGGDRFQQAIIDAVHMVKTATVLAHPVAPDSTGTVREYMNLDGRLFRWEHIFEPIDAITEEGHRFRTLPPRFDFYKKPAWQY